MTKEGEPWSRSRSLKGSRPSVPHWTNFLFFLVAVVVVVAWWIIQGPPVWGSRYSE